MSYKLSTILRYCLLLLNFALALSMTAKQDQLMENLSGEFSATINKALDDVEVFIRKVLEDETIIKAEGDKVKDLKKRAEKYIEEFNKNKESGKSAGEKLRKNIGLMHRFIFYILKLNSRHRTAEDLLIQAAIRRNQLAKLKSDSYRSFELYAEKAQKLMEDYLNSLTDEEKAGDPRTVEWLKRYSTEKNPVKKMNYIFQYVTKVYFTNN